MSDYVAPDSGTQGGTGTADTARHEAAEVEDTAAGAAKDVAGTAKDEAASVAGEAKDQARDLYRRAKGQLGDQAAKQQERLASGLGAVGQEFGSMAQGADSGLASDLAQRASDRLGAAASWLQDRDPASVLEEVKAYARRRPLVFIAGAAVAGIVVGRLTRALASSAADRSRAQRPTVGPTYGAADDGIDGPPSGEASGVVPSDYGVDGAPALVGGGVDASVGASAAYGAGERSGADDVSAADVGLDDGSGDVYAADDGLAGGTDVAQGDVIVVDDSGDTPLYETVTSTDDRAEGVDDRRDTV